MCKRKKLRMILICIYIIGGFCRKINDLYKLNPHRKKRPFTANFSKNPAIRQNTIFPLSAIMPK